ncbi:TIGR03619 family F420-dependent LLM class oxidoreductase [Phytohabitans suffuscus]|uniref:LLM class F420-dependent oxidoreductase n=1 Tax=Phytohabitans suffuscus TaxID=624315 RepID=A0A6F8YRK5_9ACTN|nr:TIGR03619 family F420-dependent LLM class oxidoreductase [Phytohabitans suffuscus]BCB88623.1 LLM class F420-dependent oxidoreductase [Phytohabitans suffuscus]
MKLGVWLPVVSTHPGSGEAGWQATGTATDLLSITQAAERLGYDCVCAPEHVGVPIGRSHGTVYWDPVSTLGFLAGGTSVIRLAVLVAVLGYHHPLELAKRYGTLQHLAGERIVLGVGAGGTQEEFDLLGASFHDRGVRADESLQAIRAAMGTTTPSFAGRHHSFGGVVVNPSLAAGTPIWVGGMSRAAVRRAVRLGDGWAPTGLTIDALREQVRTLAPQLRDRPGFEVVYLPRPEQVLNPADAPAKAAELLDAVAGAGATTLLPRLSSRSAGHYVEQLAALAEVAGQLN